MNKTAYAKVHAWDTTEARLYDLENDPQENSNLLNDAANDELAMIAQQLRKKIDDWHTVDSAVDSAFK